jgi:hypothetical protein
MPLDKRTGYIKSRIPTELWNEAKSESALENRTMTDWLMDAIRNAIITGKKQREKRCVTSMKQE